MTAGMAFEALNHAGHLKQKNLIVVLNDNEMSISPNVGALSSYLSRKLSRPMVRRMKGWAKEFLGSMPGDMGYWAHKAEESLKVFFSPGLLFEALNFKYVGPIQGHRVDVLLETFENVKTMLANGEGPILVHAITAKGYGYEPAQQDPFKYHGVGSFDVASGAFPPSKPGPPKYQNVFADTLIRLARARTSASSGSRRPWRTAPASIASRGLPGALLRRRDRRAARGDLRSGSRRRGA